MAKSDFDTAAATVKSAPHSTAAWDAIEELARDQEKPDEIVALYRDVLQKGLEPQVAEMIGERAGGFCDEWFGDDPKVAREDPVRVTRSRAVVGLRAAAPVGDLHRRRALDRRARGCTTAPSTATKDKARRIRLLREAAQLAKDVANQPDKAIGYYQRLLPLTPDDAQLSQGLERLLERHERWADLIELWEGRLERQTQEGARAQPRPHRRVLARQPEGSGAALAAVRPLLAEAEDDKEPCALLERIIESPHTPTARCARPRSICCARTTTRPTRPREVIRVLERVIELDPARSGQALREEAGARLAELDDDGAAMDHYAALLAMQPDSSATEEKLRQLAERGGQHDRYADGVAAAAAHAIMPTRQVELLGEAARTRLERLDDVDGAIELLVEAPST